MFAINKIEKKTEKEIIIAELLEVRSLICSSYTQFEELTDAELIESTLLLIKSLEIKSRYLNSKLKTITR